ncbi:Protein of unknown function [Gryllus bimaculatus]|nr:Protein of unknown function [Gryllus bimaculatus]
MQLLADGQLMVVTLLQCNTHTKLRPELRGEVECLVRVAWWKEDENGRFTEINCEDLGLTMTSTAQTWKHTAVAFQEEMCYNLSDVDWDAYEEAEAVNQNHAVLLSHGNITQMHSFEHWESLLNEYEKFSLRRLLMRFTEPIRKVILKLCDSLFQIMGKARGLDLMHIVSFVSEFVRFLISCIYNGEKLFVLSLLQFAIHEIPFDGMSCYQFCLALFEEFLLRPDSLIYIYNLIQSFFAVSSERTQMSWQLQNVDFIQLVSVCSVLLKTDKIYWEMIIDFAKNIFDSLNLKKYSSLVRILKELLLHIQERILATQRRYEMHRHESRGIEEVALNSYDRQIRSDSVSVLESMYEEEFSTSFANKLQGMNLNEGSGESIPLKNVVSPFTMDNPLSFQKHFWDREQLELLTEKEIFEICKSTLRMDDLPQKCFIMYDGLDSFVTIGDTVVVIRCDLHKETVESYAVPPVSTLVQNDEP